MKSVMTEDRSRVLRLLAKRPATSVDLQSDRNITVAQDLVRMGYARDFADHAGHRIPIRLRIWGITDAGRAVLEQQALAVSSANRGGQFSLTINTNAPKPDTPKE